MDLISPLHKISPTQHQPIQIDPIPLTDILQNDLHMYLTQLLHVYFNRLDPVHDLSIEVVHIENPMDYRLIKINALVDHCQ
jgi:hypothetical protein